MHQYSRSSQAPGGNGPTKQTNKGGRKERDPPAENCSKAAKLTWKYCLAKRRQRRKKQAHADETGTQPMSQMEHDEHDVVDSSGGEVIQRLTR